MRKLLVCLTFAATALFADYKADPAGPPPGELHASVSALLNKQGVKISDGGKTIAEVWFRNAMPTGGAAEDMVSLTGVPHGAVLAAIRFPDGWSDRRGQKIPPGVYTMRYSLFPQNGDHQGVAPQRDFLLLINAAEDTEGGANWDYKKVTTSSMKVSKTPHPAVFSLWKAEASDPQGIAALGEHDQVLRTKIGDTPVAIIFLGKAEG